MTLLDNFPHTATAQIRTRLRDGIGGGKDTYTNVFTGRSCWQQPAGDSDILEYQKMGVRITNKVYFLTDPGLGVKHILIIGGETFDVKSESAPDASAGLGVVWRVMVERKTTDR